MEDTLSSAAVGGSVKKTSDSVILPLLGGTFLEGEPGVESAEKMVLYKLCPVVRPDRLNESPKTPVFNRDLPALKKRHTLRLSKWTSTRVF